MSFEQKVDVIKRRSAELESKVNSLADLFLKKLIDEFVDRLDTKDGVIQNTPGNLALLNQIDRLFLEFNARVAGPQITETVAKGVKEIHGLNMDYFQQFSDGQAQYKATADQVEKIMLDRLGFGEKTKLKEGGFMDTMFKDPTIANQIKNFARTELIKGPGFKDFKTGLGRLIKTDQNSMGAFERYYRNYAYDLFVNVDREESLLTAKALNLTYFIYAGTIIDTSREFCRKRVGKVFTTEEADAWRNDDWIKRALEKGYIASYDPVRDMGLFGCRHVPQFVSKEVAERMRPDLKTKTDPPTKETPPAPKPEPKPKPEKPKPEWKPSMTDSEAKDWVKKSALREPGWHGTSIENADKIAESGFQFSKKTAGRVWGNGVYYAETKALAQQYADVFGKVNGKGTIVKVYANVKKPLVFDFSDQQVGDDMFAWLRFQRDIPQLQKKSNPDWHEKYQAEYDRLSKKYSDWQNNKPHKDKDFDRLTEKEKNDIVVWMDSEPFDLDDQIGLAREKATKDLGHDAIQIKFPLYKGISNNQTVVFDPKQVTIVKL